MAEKYWQDAEQEAERDFLCLTKNATSVNRSSISIRFINVDRRFFFRKEERLTGKVAIERLFTEKSRSIFVYPLRVSWVENKAEADPAVRVLFTVPKKRFRLAWHRNRVKRILREVYRKNSHLLKDSLTSKEKKILLAISYVGEKEIDQHQVERIFLSIVERFMEQAD